LQLLKQQQQQQQQKDCNNNNNHYEKHKKNIIAVSLTVRCTVRVHRNNKICFQNILFEEI